MSIILSGLIHLFRPLLSSLSGALDCEGLGPWYFLLGLRIVAIFFSNGPWDKAKEDVICNWIAPVQEKALTFCTALCNNQHFALSISATWGLVFLLNLLYVGLMRLSTPEGKKDEEKEKDKSKEKDKEKDKGLAVVASAPHSGVPDISTVYTIGHRGLPRSGGYAGRDDDDDDDDRYYRRRRYYPFYPYPPYWAPWYGSMGEGYGPFSPYDPYGPGSYGGGEYGMPGEEGYGDGRRGTGGHSDGRPGARGHSAPGSGSHSMPTEGGPSMPAEGYGGSTGGGYGGSAHGGYGGSTGGGYGGSTGGGYGSSTGGGYGGSTGGGYGGSTGGGYGGSTGGGYGGSTGGGYGGSTGGGFSLPLEEAFIIPPEEGHVMPDDEGRSVPADEACGVSATGGMPPDGGYGMPIHPGYTGKTHCYNMAQRKMGVGPMDSRQTKASPRHDRAKQTKAASRCDEMEQYKVPTKSVPVPINGSPYRSKYKSATKCRPVIESNVDCKGSAFQPWMDDKENMALKRRNNRNHVPNKSQGGFGKQAPPPQMAEDSNMTCQSRPIGGQGMTPGPGIPTGAPFCCHDDAGCPCAENASCPCCQPSGGAEPSSTTKPTDSAPGSQEKAKKTITNLCGVPFFDIWVGFLLATEIAFLCVIIVLQMPSLLGRSWFCTPGAASCAASVECVVRGRAEKRVALWGLVLTCILFIIACSGYFYLRTCWNRGCCKRCREEVTENKVEANTEPEGRVMRGDVEELVGWPQSEEVQRLYQLTDD
uniref:Uncharacterized protein n=1 Tax=Sphaerodactylus townsendi TaxID=933632 RepID=A0ACB8EX69_9SAUR